MSVSEFQTYLFDLHSPLARKTILLMPVPSSRLGAMPNRLIALLNDEPSRHLTWRGLKLTLQP